jgi:SAM-dependent methyltransferase
MTNEEIGRRLPRFLRRYILDFEARIEDAVAKFAAETPRGALVLDAGAGEGRHRAPFAAARYVGVDLAVGDVAWDYSRLDAVADLTRLPFRDASFDSALNVVTLEHVRDPGLALSEISRVLRPGSGFLLAVPHEWEVHQAPHDYFRYTRHGVEALLSGAGFEIVSLAPAGGFFRLLSRRLFNALQFFPGVFYLAGAMLFVPAALLAPLLDPLDRRRDFTLGYICRARKRS